MKAISLNDTATIFPLKAYSGGSTLKFKAIKGSKLVVSLYVKSLTSADVTVKIRNSFSESVPFREKAELTVDSAGGFDDVIVMDFHEIFEIELIGDGEVAVGVSLYDDGRGGSQSTAEAIDELNRLVPEFYDDVEVLSRTPGDQPVTVEFRLEGEVVRNLLLTYDGEVFIRAQKL